MASNVSAIADENGEYDAWVELYNSGTNTVDLEGYYLSDNENDLVKWQFPAVTIPADDYLVIWLDGEHGLQEGLHTSFKLSADGEELFLSTPNEYVLDAIFYTNLPSDLAFARVPNGSGPFTIQEQTHNTSNNLTIYIAEHNNSSKIYPNPSSTSLTIEHRGNQHIEIYSILGRKILEKVSKDSKMNIDCERWPKGIYLVKVGSETHKIVVQ